MGIKSWMYDNAPDGMRDYYEYKRQSWLSRGLGHIFIEPTRRVTNYRELLLLYRDDPMSQASIKKKSKDLFEAGFEIIGAEQELKEEMEKFIRDKDVRMAWQFSRAARDALIYGNGFLEIEFQNDVNVDDAAAEPIGDDIPALHNINPENIVVIEDDRVDSETYGRITGYFSMPPTGGIAHTNTFLTVTETHQNIYARRGKRLHPDRIIHIMFDTVGDSNTGISSLEPAFNIMKSKIAADQALGVIITRFSKPILEAIIKKGAKPGEIRKAQRMLSAMNKTPDKISYIAHDEFLEFKIPGMGNKALRPKEYYDILIDQLSIQFGVPKRLLIGTEAGTISGSELNLVAYFQSIESDQKTVIKPLIMQLLNSWHEARFGSPLPKEIDIEFGGLYADEIAAIKTSMLGMQTLVMAYQSGLITIEAARKKASSLLNVENSDDENDFVQSVIDKKLPKEEKPDAFNPNQPAVKTPDQEEMEDAIEALQDTVMEIQSKVFE